jgi:hypothetical protein
MLLSRRIMAVASLAALAGIGACSDHVTDPGPGAPSLGRAAAAPRMSEAARWNAISRGLSQQYRPPQHIGARGLAYLSLAQYNAVVAAVDERGSVAVQRGAAAGASVAVLTWLYPAEAAYLESLTGWQEAGGAAAYDAGVVIGRAVGARVIASAAADDFALPWTGAVPTGPSFWFSPAPPIAPRLGEMRTFFLRSGSQFRPDPPPAFGSETFNRALAAVRLYSDTRTPEQDALAKFWAVPGGFALIPAYENLLASDLITGQALSERDAAHAFALINMAAMDGFIACHDAKYTYWLLRPTMADPAITTSVPVPNHPSYPSNHACVTGAFMATLGRIFPARARQLNALADEAAFSRIVGGIHYDFDGSTGLTIGRKVAAWVVEHDVAPGQPFPIR